jgi:hypothetical protein
MFLRKFIIISLIGSASLLASQTQAYMIGFKSADNTISNIQTIESKYKIKLPIVSFIFDPRTPDVLNTINRLPSTLGDARIYHITLSPNSLSAQQVTD